MNWFERMFGGQEDETPVKSALNAIDKYPELKDQLDAMRAATAYGAGEKPKMDGIGMFAAALDAASVPVAYAQGNMDFANAHQGHTLANEFNKRSADYEDSQRSSMDAMSGNLGLNYIKNKYEQKQKAIDMISAYKAAGIDVPDEVYAQAGMQKPVDPTGTGTSSPGIAPPSPTPQDAPVSGGAGPSSMTGQATPDTGPQGVQFSPALAEKAKKAQALLINPATRAIGESMLSQVKIEMQAEADLWEKQQASKFTKSNISNSTLVYGTDKDGNPVVMQPSSEGKLMRSEVPEGVEVLGPGGVAQAKKIGGVFGKRYENMLESADSAQTQLAVLGQMKQGLDTGVYQGFAGMPIQNLRKLYIAMGLGDAETINQVASGEMINGISNKMTLAVRADPAGGGMPGSLSDNDIRFLKAMQPSLENTPAGNAKLIDLYSKIAHRNIQVAQFADEYVAQHGGLDPQFSIQMRQWAKDNPLFPDAPPVGGTTEEPNRTSSGFKIKRISP